MFKELEKIISRPKPFEFYTTQALWDDEYTSEQMLKYHLNSEVDLSSRNHSFIENSINWIVSHFKIGTNTSIADFGCGPGLYSSKLAKCGAKVTGIDFSKRSIEYAQDFALKNSLNINYMNENYLNYESHEKYDLIIMIMCDYCVLSPCQRNRLLNVFKKHLKKDGRILFDVYSYFAFDKREECASYQMNSLNGFWSKENYFGFLNTHKYNDEKVVLDKYSIVGQNVNKVIYNWHQYFSPDVLKSELHRQGFNIEQMFSNVSGEAYDNKSDEFAIVAKQIE